MTPIAREARLANFLMLNPGREFCDPCLAGEILLPFHEVVEVAEELARQPGFLRDRWVCGVCGRRTTVIRSLRRRPTVPEPTRLTPTLRLVIEQLPIVLWTTNAHLRVASSMGAGLGAIGLRPGDYVGTPIGEYLGIDDESFPALAAHRDALRGHAGFFEFRWKARMQLAHVEPLRRDDGTVDGVAGIAVDITDRLAADEARARLAAIVEGSDDAIVSKTLDGMVLTWNRSAEAVFGWTADEIVGRSIGVIVPPNRQAESAEITERILREEHVHMETERLRRDGRRFPVALTASPVRNPEGKTVAISIIARDITERRRAEAAAIEAARLQAAMSLALSAAHEINNPLMVVVGELDLLARRLAGDPVAARRIITARAAGERINEIVNSLGAITRLHPAPQSSHIPMLDLRRSAEADAADEAAATDT